MPTSTASPSPHSLTLHNFSTRCSENQLGDAGAATIAAALARLTALQTLNLR